MIVKIVLILLVTLASEGCGSTSKNGDDEGKNDAIKIEELSRSKNFDRKVQCEKYASQIRAEWKDEDRDESARLKLHLEEPPSTIEQIFYSPVRNSCVCVGRQQMTLTDSKSSFHDFHIFIFDVLTKESIWGKVYSNANQAADVQKDIAEQIDLLSRPPNKH